MLKRALPRKFTILGALVAIAALAAPTGASAKRFAGLVDGPADQIATFSDGSLASVSIKNITGLTSGEEILSIDRNPDDGKIYMLSLTTTPNWRLRTVDPATGVVSGGVTLSSNLVDTPTEIDFDPVADTIRAINSSGNNYTIIPATGVVFPNTNMSAGVTAGPPTQVPSVGGLAYTNSVPGAIDTQMYIYDFSHDILDEVPSPSTGVAYRVGLGSGYSLGGSAFDVGFDIAPDNTAWVSGFIVSSGQNTNLFQMNLTTGVMVSKGQIGTDVSDITYIGEDPVVPGNPVVGTVTSGSLGTDKKGNATATLSCPAGAATCGASYSLDTTKAVAAAKKKKKKKLKLGSGKTTIPAGTSRKVTIKLSSKGKKLLKKKKKLAVTLTVTSATITKKTGTLKQPKKKKKKK